VLDLKSFPRWGRLTRALPSLLWLLYPFRVVIYLSGQIRWYSFICSLGEANESTLSAQFAILSYPGGDRLVVLNLESFVRWGRLTRMLPRLVWLLFLFRMAICLSGLIHRYSFVYLFWEANKSTPSIQFTIFTHRCESIIQIGEVY